jgi:hypothetical protein
MKIRDAMGARDAKYELNGVIELDGAVFGHEKGGTIAKVYLAVEVGIAADGKPRARFAKARVVPAFKGDAANQFAKQNVKPGANLRTDQGKDMLHLKKNFKVFARPMWGIQHRIDEHLPWVHRVISNIKANLIGTFHGVDAKYLQLYLDEACYRFNRRFWRDEIATRLVTACIQVRQ